MRRHIALTLAVALGCACAAEGKELSAEARRCLPLAADHYRVDADLVEAISGAESSCGMKLTNDNGSEDYGCMGVNSIHNAKFAELKVTPEKLIKDDCLNMYVGTSILKGELVKEPNLWKAIGNYRSHTAKYNLEYQRIVWKQLQKIRAKRGLNSAP